MAERRMFSKIIIDSDSFLDMPLSTQALYFHLGMRADDEGFVNNPKKILRMVNASEDDLKVLITKQFIIPFDSGVVVIRHWRIHNYIQSDRRKDTMYVEEKMQLLLSDSGTYELEPEPCIQNGYKMDTSCIQTVSKMDTECIQDGYIGKDSIDKNSIEEPKEEKAKREKSEAKQAANLLFEKMWKLYPVKRGKGSVSDTAKLRLLKVGEEQLRKSIQRYLDENERLRVSGKFCPEFVNGSTFFNSRYIDYLDENYLTNDHADIQDDDSDVSDDSPFGDWQ